MWSDSTYPFLKVVGGWVGGGRGLVMDYKTRKVIGVLYKREKRYKFKDIISLSFLATTNHLITFKAYIHL